MRKNDVLIDELQRQLALSRENEHNAQTLAESLRRDADDKGAAEQRCATLESSLEVATRDLQALDVTRQQLQAEQQRATSEIERLLSIASELDELEAERSRLEGVAEAERTSHADTRATLRKHAASARALGCVYLRQCHLLRRQIADGEAREEAPMRRAAASDDQMGSTEPQSSRTSCMRVASSAVYDSTHSRSASALSRTQV